MQTKEDALNKLSKSKFRSRFKLSPADIEYIDSKGLDTVRSHAKDFVKKKLETRFAYDGKQTPMTGHPVFKAMHGGAAAKFDIREWALEREKMGKGVTLNEEEAEELYKALSKYFG